jgi:hypothetical protein
MRVATNSSAEAAALVLALAVAANGRIDERELRTLDELDAFRRLDVPRERFVEMARECLETVGSHLREQSWLPAACRAYADRLLHQVREPAQRLLVCRLAAAAITADGRVTRDERLVYEHLLASWRISQTMVAHAIIGDRAH